ncbi:MAG: hypothetical protein LBN42_03690 [Oscillospiraceae bacterium]|jgi:flagellar assembly protein FliH|nr:hypothetical protein [Oscillospiraceae bacterium]
MANATVIKAGDYDTGGRFVRIQGNPALSLPNDSSKMKRIGFSAPPNIKSAFGNMNATSWREDEWGNTPANVGAQSLDLEPEEDLPPLPTREEVEAEYKILKDRYVREGEKLLADAKVRAEDMRTKAYKEIREQYVDAEEDCAAMRKEALDSGYKDGYDRGHKEGDEAGYKDGYDKGFSLCKETLDELLKMVGEFPRLREEYYTKHTQDLFNTIFFVANKVTKGLLAQKEKGVIQRNLKELAKGYRETEYIRITLSAIDVADFVEADYEQIKELFTGVKNVEFELAKDNGGTIMVENADGLTDSSIETQLKAIRDLAKGKYKKK